MKIGNDNVVVVDLGLGNLSSVVNMVKKAGGEPIISSSAQVLSTAKKIILPGVGSFGAGMEAINRLGLNDPLQNIVKTKGTPILGLCMGMQIFAKLGYENGVYEGLGLIDAVAEKLDIDSCKVLPHIGWNNIIDESASNIHLFNGLPSSPHFYFVHSYHLSKLNTEIKSSFCRYNDQYVTSAIKYHNVYGAQFHPEKSLNNGLLFIKNFIKNA